MIEALKELISPLSRSVDGLATQLDLGAKEINLQISGIQGQMIEAEKDFQRFQQSHIDFCAETQRNFAQLKSESIL